MKVLVVEPNCAPYEKEINGLREMQAVVGGMIQAIYPFQEPVAVVCNEEGIITGLPFNRSMDGGYGAVFGTFFICGLAKEDFCSLSPKQIEHYRSKFYRAEILVGAGGGELITIKVPPHKKNKPPGEKERGIPERE